MATRKGASGGAAGTAGVGYEQEVAAYFAVAVLAEEQRFELPWMAATTTVEEVACQTGANTDDVEVADSSGTRVLIQAKTNVSLDGKLSSAFMQFLADYLAAKSSAHSIPCFCFATSSGSTTTVRRHLRTVLDEARLQPDWQKIGSTNADVRKARDWVATVVRSGWTPAGSSPTDAEVRTFLAGCYVLELSMEVGQGSARDHAMTLLRSTILEDPSEAEKAWNTLTTCARELAEAHGRADRQTVHAKLAAAGLRLKGTPSFRTDIARLQTVTAEDLETLSARSHIAFGSTEVRVRRGIAKRVKTQALAGSVVLVGEPGIGKSGQLHELAVALRTEGHDVVLLTPDRLDGALSMDNALRLSHEFELVLRNWPGDNAAFVIVDGLDEAISSDPRTFLIRTLKNLCHGVGRWRLVAAIRTYDLANHRDLSILFAGRRIEVGALGPEEWREVESQSKELWSFVEDASPHLRELLDNVFNLMLVANLLGEPGPTVDRLKAATTQYELLSALWERRVHNNSRRELGRRQAIQASTTEMLERRSLLGSKDAIATRLGAAGGEYLSDILLSGLVVEGPATGRQVRFSHRVVFDYAVSSSWDVGNPEGVIDEQNADAGWRALFLRQSQRFHLNRLWLLREDRSQFWAFVRLLHERASLPEISRLLASVVATEHVDLPSDLQRLLGFALAPPIVRIVGQMSTALGQKVRSPEPWLSLVEWMVRHIQAGGPNSESLAFPLRTLVDKLSKHEGLTGNQRRQLNEAAEGLIRFNWKGGRYVVPLAYVGFRVLVATLSERFEESASLLREALMPEHLEKHAAKELGLLAGVAPVLAASAPDLVVALYRAAFSYEEKSEESTEMDSSQIIRFVTSRKQDVEQARWELSEVFPLVMKAAPVAATQAMSLVMDAQGAERNVGRTTPEWTFVFCGRPAVLKLDWSFSWDAGEHHRHEAALRIADAYEKGLVEQTELAGILEVFQGVRSAATWRRLVHCMARAPQTVGLAASSLLEAPELLGSYCLRKELGDAIAVVFGLLEEEARVRIEQAILSVTYEEARDRLIGCIPGEQIVTSAVRSRLSEMQATQSVPPNVPMFSSSSSLEPFVSDGWLRDLGIPMDAPENSHLHALMEPVKAIVGHARRTNEQKGKSHALDTGPDLSVAWASIQALFDHLSASNANATVVETAWENLAEAAHWAAQTVKAEDRVIDQIEALLAVGALSGSARTRGDSARGLCVLSSKSNGVASRAGVQIESLARDPSKDVRLWVANDLRYLERFAQEALMRAVDELTSLESDPMVLMALVGSLNSVANQASSRRSWALAKLRQIWDRCSDPQYDELLNMCATQFGAWYLEVEDEIAREIVDDLLHVDRVATSQTVRLLHQADDRILHRDDEKRNRALGVVRRIAEGAIERWRHLKSSDPDVKDVLDCLDQLGHTVQDAIGVRDGRGRSDGDQTIPPETRQRFLREIAPVLDLLSDVALPALTHKLLEGMERAIDFDPPAALLWAARTVRAGTQAGYEYEAMGVDVALRLVQLVIAEHQKLLVEREDCRSALVVILDSFVRAGWPQTFELVSRLENVFR